MTEQAIEWILCRAAENTAKPEENEKVVAYLLALLQKEENK